MVSYDDVDDDDGDDALLSRVYSRLSRVHGRLYIYYFVVRLFLFSLLLLSWRAEHVCACEYRLQSPDYACHYMRCSIVCVRVSACEKSMKPTTYTMVCVCMCVSALNVQCFWCTWLKSCILLLFLLQTFFVRLTSTIKCTNETRTRNNSNNSNNKKLVAG